MPVKKGIKNQELGIKEKKTAKSVIASKAKQSQETATPQAPRSDKATKTGRMEASLTIDVFDVKGGKTTMTLPAEVFGVAVNKTLLAQAVRVYLANQRVGSAKAQTRGEVTGSTRKIYQQKGTGRARHGGIRAPLFVGGGAAHGPRLHDFSLSLPRKMRKIALFSALTSKKEEGNITIIKGLETLEAKTKAVAAVLKKIGVKGKSTMLVLPTEAQKRGNVAKSARNIKGVSIIPVGQLNTYEVLKSTTVLFMQDAIESLKAISKEK
jgi:large subunit ribosomal protein L4